VPFKVLNWFLAEFTPAAGMPLTSNHGVALSADSIGVNRRASRDYVVSEIKLVPRFPLLCCAIPGDFWVMSSIMLYQVAIVRSDAALCTVNFSFKYRCINFDECNCNI
jgi:hypothetical protein